MCFVPQWCALFRHSLPLPKLFRTWGVFRLLGFWLPGVQFVISHLARWLHARHFSEPTFLSLQSCTTLEKHIVSRLFAHLYLLSADSFSSFSSLTLSSSAFPSVHNIVGSLTSKLPSIIQARHCSQLSPPTFDAKMPVDAQNASRFLIAFWEPGWFNAPRGIADGALRPGPWGLPASSIQGHTGSVSHNMCHGQDLGILV